MQLPIELKQAIDNNAFCALATKLNEKEIQKWNDEKSIERTKLLRPNLFDND